MRHIQFMTLALLLPTVALALPFSGAPTAERGRLLELALASRPPDSKPDLGFDLLGEAPAPPPIDDRLLTERRAMLKVHQGVGLALLTLELATTLLGQLNYQDRFAGGQTNRFKQIHAGLAYATFTLFATNAAIALVAPKPLGAERTRFDRIALHRVSMLVAGAGMIAQVVLGVITSQHVGLANQRTLAQVHLGVGYGTLAAMAVGVGALVF
jgi:hypothetical protein